ncbi:muscular LMNA-interacting protein isoform X3 [Coregonus clupeaformis]|uniref:muscular LMNA-interacting protein isoform X3 n=2 Tax=Coregonus clupeaformis TaxID=59861 RepID=UPI001E1C2AA5|nr:muscular LMNA-interacting protein isoform X3 [Coregonus clupeaformis]
MDLSSPESISPLPGHKQCLDVEKSDSSHESQGKVSEEEVSSKLLFYTFVPELKTLPIKITLTEAAKTGLLTGKPNKNLGVPKQKVTEDTMSDGGLFKAEVIYIRDCEKRGAGDMVQQETNTWLISPPDHTTPPQTPPPINAQAENTAYHFVSGPATMETAVNKHQGIYQQQCHNTPVGAEVSSGLFLNRASDSDERLSPANSTDLFPASSKSQSQESILSESWDKDRSWSALQMSPETSRAVSPCSSVRSGMFTPSVVRVKRHSLEPGSSLVHMPPTCFSPPCCESPSLSPCPLSPRSRHRPPPTRLSLLTAILRKGRLPVLSPTLTLQRPYSPCWPIHHGTSCNACSAASSVASIPLEVFSSRAQSSASIHSPAQSYRHRDGCVLESLRSVNAPPSIESKELSTSWRMVGPHSPPLRHSDELKSNNGIISERVTSPSYRSLGVSPVPPLSQPFPQNLPKPVDYTKVPSPPLYSSHSRLRHLSPEPLNNSVNSRLNSLSPEPKPVKNKGASEPHNSNQPLYLSHSRLKCLSPNPAHNQGTSACQPLYSSFSKLRSLSPGPVNTSSNSTLDSLSAEPKPVSKNLVQALNSHLRSKLSFLSSAPANNQETFKALVTSTPEVSSMGTSNNRGTSMGTLNTWGTIRPPVWSPLPYSCLSRLSPKPSSLSCCAPEGHLSAPSHSPSGTVSSAQRHTDAISPTPLQNGLKTPPHSRLQLSVSPATRAFHLTPTLYTPPGCPSPKPPTPPTTPDRFTLSPSPAPPTRDLTPSPSLSLRSTPSPCLWREMSDSLETKRKPHKIKLSYKALAAIPTNTLLLDQQAIDDQVDKEGDSQDPVDIRKQEDTHAEMCSPAQLRKQSKDLYAVIDQVLEDPIPMRQVSPALAHPRESRDKCAPKRYTSLPRSLGRETKYATFNLQPSVERKLADTYKTKPGVIRPANIIPRLPEENYDEVFHPNPFKQYLEELTVNDQNKIGAGGNVSSGNLALNTEKTSESNSTTEEEDNISISSLLITESDPAKDGSWQGGATSFNPTNVKMEAFETHI